MGRVIQNWDNFKLMVEDCKNAETADTFSFESIVGSRSGGYYSRINCLYHFVLLWRCIPSKFLYDTYKYCLSDVEGSAYYKEFFDKELLSNIKKLNQYDTIDNPALTALLDEKGFITIYHGHCKPTMRNSNWSDII